MKILVDDIILVETDSVMYAAYRSESTEKKTEGHYLKIVFNSGDGIELTGESKDYVMAALKKLEGAIRDYPH